MSENGMEGKGTSVEVTLALGADFIVSADHRERVIAAIEKALLPDAAGLFLQAIAWRQTTSNGEMPALNGLLRLHKLDGSIVELRDAPAQDAVVGITREE